MFQRGVDREDVAHDAPGIFVEDAVAGDVAEGVWGGGDGFPDRPHDVGLAVQGRDLGVDFVGGVFVERLD